LFRPSTPCLNLKMAGASVYFTMNRRNGIRSGAEKPIE